MAAPDAERLVEYQKVSGGRSLADIQHDIEASRREIATAVNDLEAAARQITTPAHWGRVAVRTFERHPMPVLVAVFGAAYLAGTALIPSRPRDRFVYEDEVED